jgi:hypothetical protein
MGLYLKIKLYNIEPLRIADDSSSQSGQTSSLRYIPGTTIRGFAVNALKNEPNFEEIKKVLLSEKVYFCNAYPMKGKEELLPSPKGFYADKAGNTLVNSLALEENKDIPEGYKRASLGAFCSIKDNTLYGYNVQMGSDLKINTGRNGDKQNVFRNEYIAPNQAFCGYIAVSDETVKEKLCKVFGSKTVVLGNARSAGYGKCRVECEETNEQPFNEYMPKHQPDGKCYMMLLSNTVMRDENGEYCGIDVSELEKLLGVKNLEILACATSTVDVRGYNRQWGGKTPSIVMYEKGSVFCLKFDGTLTASNMENVCSTGIGVRKNEGFGRVLFLDNYSDINEHKDCGMVSNECNTENQIRANKEENEETLKIVAKRYYRNIISRAMEWYALDNSSSFGNISDSQLGQIDSIATQYKYETEEAVKALRKLLDHAREKSESNNAQKNVSDWGMVGKLCEDLFGKDGEDKGKPLGEFLKERIKEKADYLTKLTADSLMGVERKDFFSDEDERRYKLELLVMIIRLHNKKEAV